MSQVDINTLQEMLNKEKEKRRKLKQMINEIESKQQIKRNRSLVETIPGTYVSRCYIMDKLNALIFHLKEQGKDSDIENVVLGLCGIYNELSGYEKIPLHELRISKKTKREEFQEKVTEFVSKKLAEQDKEMTVTIHFSKDEEEEEEETA